MGDAEALESASRRAAAVAASWAERPDPGEPYHWSSPGGSVALSRVEAVVEGELIYVRVWVGDDLEGPAHFKIINPPLIYVTPDGSWVEDPLMALAATIVSQSRATARKGKR